VWGLTINEAMASAKPVITTWAAGAAHDIVFPGETGWVALPGSVASLEAMLEAAVTVGEQRRHMMGQAAQHFALTNLTLERCAEGIVQACHAAIERGS